MRCHVQQRSVDTNIVVRYLRYICDVKTVMLGSSDDYYLFHTTTFIVPFQFQKLTYDWASPQSCTTCPSHNAVEIVRG